MAKPSGLELRFQPTVSSPMFTVAQQTSSMIVGCGVWEAGVALIFWLAKNPRYITNKRVLELGAGCGQTAIAAGVLGAKSVVVTDLDEVSRAMLSATRPLRRRLRCSACHGTTKPTSRL